MRVRSVVVFVNVIGSPKGKEKPCFSIRYYVTFAKLSSEMVPEQEYVITAVHDDESLTCTAYSKRQETISWRITNDDGSSVDITENVETLNTSSTYVSRSVLRLTDVQMSNSSRGIECWFQPEAGSEKVGTITLDVFGKTFKRLEYYLENKFTLSLEK